MFIRFAAMSLLQKIGNKNSKKMLLLCKKNKKLIKKFKVSDFYITILLKNTNKQTITETKEIFLKSLFLIFILAIIFATFL